MTQIILFYVNPNDALQSKTLKRDPLRLNCGNRLDNITCMKYKTVSNNFIFHTNKIKIADTLPKAT